MQILNETSTLDRSKYKIIFREKNAFCYNHGCSARHDVFVKVITLLK